MLIWKGYGLINEKNGCHHTGPKKIYDISKHITLLAKAQIYKCNVLFLGTFPFGNLPSWIEFPMESSKLTFSTAFCFRLPAVLWKVFKCTKRRRISVENDGKSYLIHYMAKINCCRSALVLEAEMLRILTIRQGSKWISGKVMIYLHHPIDAEKCAHFLGYGLYLYSLQKQWSKRRKIDNSQKCWRG